MERCTTIQATAGKDAENLLVQPDKPNTNYDVHWLRMVKGTRNKCSS